MPLSVDPNQNLITYQDDKDNSTGRGEMIYTYKVKEEKADNGLDTHMLYLTPKNEEAQRDFNQTNPRVLGLTGGIPDGHGVIKYDIDFIKKMVFTNQELNKLLGVHQTAGKRRNTRRRNRKSKKTRTSRKNRRKSKRTSRR